MKLDYTNNSIDTSELCMSDFSLIPVLNVCLLLGQTIHSDSPWKVQAVITPMIGLPEGKQVALSLLSLAHSLC